MAELFYRSIEILNSFLPHFFIAEPRIIKRKLKTVHVEQGEG